MKSIRNRLNFVAISLVAAVVGTASAADLLVPSQYNTIQSAIDAAVSGDHVLVSEGTYLGQVNLSGKNIQLIGVSGATSTIIDGENAHTVMIGNGEPSTCLVQGFTIKNGYDKDCNSGGCGGGVMLVNSSVKFLKCYFLNNKVTDVNLWGAGAWRSSGGAPVVEECFFQGNKGSFTCSSIYHYLSGTIIIRDCVFIDNETKKTSNNGEDGGDIHIQSEGSDINSIIDRCTFQRHIGYLGIGISMDKYYGGAMTSIISDCKFESPVFHDGYNYQLTTAVRVGGHDSGTYSITRTNNLTCGVKKDYSAPNWARIVTVSSGNILDQDCPDSDSDSDGIIYAQDNCPQVYNPQQEDCDGNGVGDACEIDCDGNGSADICDIANGTAKDCNVNGIPDFCDIASGLAKDCNSNGIPDSCDIANGTAKDCNGNGIPDFCDIASGLAKDCNSSGIPDSCEIFSGAVTDINDNYIPDSCDVVSGLLNDYNHNGIADSTELVTVTAQLAIVTAQLQCGDLDGSGDVGSEDLGMLLLNYGPCEGASLTTPQEPMIFQSVETPNPVLNKK